jgi:hypothetical protein
VAFVLVSVIALLYGVSPQWFGRTFLDLPQLDSNIAHILARGHGFVYRVRRFWLYAAFHAPFRARRS